MNERAFALIRAAHPEPGAAVTLAAVALAVAAGHGLWGVLSVGATVAASQLATGWHNDWLDAGRDTVAARADKPIATGAVDHRTVGVCGLVAAALMVPIALTTGWAAAVIAGAALGSALLYNAYFKHTPLSVLPYAVSFAALPCFVISALPTTPLAPMWLALAGALLGAGAHFANVLPDLDVDARTGVHGLPHRLGAVGSQLAAAVLLLAATATLALGPPGPPGWFGLSGLLAAVVILPLGGYAAQRATKRDQRPVAAFRAVLIVALIDVSLLVASGRIAS